MILLLLLLILSLTKLQVFEHQHFTTLSQDNRVKVQPLPPTRGLIYDRNGTILAQNVSTHSLEITPERVPDLEQTLEQLGKIIIITEKDRKRFDRLRRQQRRFDSIPIRVHLEEEEVARFAVNRHRFPGVDIQAKLLRGYPLGEKVNALGRVIRVLKSQAPIPGQDLHLSLDAGLQDVAVTAFGDYTGAAVAIDPQTGELLALVSNPGFDPNLFVEGITYSDYQALQESEDKPLFNRALKGQYPPGSTVKPFIALAGLETGTVGPEQKKYCPGFYRLPGHKHRYRDWKKQGHGPVNLRDAITQSCDVYFYDLAYQLGIDRLHDSLSEFGFGTRTGVDIAGERGGLMPSREWKRRSRNQPWYPGETLITGIGQGYFLTTPLQLAHATATLATGGLRITPRVVQSVRAVDQEEPTPLEPVSSLLLAQQDPTNWDRVVEAMVQVIEGARGTAKRIRNSNYRIAGKTGTSQVFTVKQDEKYDEEEVDEKLRDHALFIAFAPVEDPRIAVAVIVENGGHGGSVAAPIAGSIMQYHLEGKKP